MWSIAAPVVATVVGLVAAVLAVFIFSREIESRQDWFLSRIGLGSVSILTGGCLFAVGGQYKLYRMLYHQSWRAELRAARMETQAQFQSTLQDPFDGLTVRVYGSDPLRDCLDACSLRLRLIPKAGPSFVSEVTQNRMGASPESLEGSRDYLLAWRTVVEGTTSAEGREAADRIRYIRDWRRIQRIEADIVFRSAQSVSMPDSLDIFANEDGSVVLFQGGPKATPLPGSGASVVGLLSTPLGIGPFLAAATLIPGTTKGPASSGVRQGDTWFSAYGDELSTADRLTFAPEPFPPPPEDELGTILEGFLAAGGLFLALGLGVVFFGHDWELAKLRRELDVQEKRAREHPGNAEHQNVLARAYYNLGAFWHHTRPNLPEAETAYRQALTLQEKLVSEHPSVLAYQHGMAKSHVGLGMVCHSTRRSDLAETAYRQALVLLERLVEAQPTLAEYVFDLALTCGLLGDVVKDSDKPEAALEWYAQAFRRLESVLQLDKEHALAKEFLPAMQHQRDQLSNQLTRDSESKTGSISSR